MKFSLFQPTWKFGLCVTRIFLQYRIKKSQTVSEVNMMYVPIFGHLYGISCEKGALGSFFFQKWIKWADFFFSKYYTHSYPFTGQKLLAHLVHLLKKCILRVRIVFLDPPCLSAGPIKSAPSVSLPVCNAKFSYFPP